MRIALSRSGKEKLERHWPLIRRAATMVFFALVAYLLVTHAQTIEWDKVAEALTAYQPKVLILAGLLAWGVILVYSCYDLMGRHYLYQDQLQRDGKHRDHFRKNLPKRRVLVITFVSYVFNLNLGALVGGFAFRYRLYSRLGLSSKQITTILGLSVGTNWLGYCLLGGLIFLFDILALPEGWRISGTVLQLIGAVMLLMPVGYLLICALRGGNTIRVRGNRIRIPQLYTAVIQLILSCLHWLLMSSVIFVLLHQQVDFVMVMGVLLLSGIAGALTHVPGALGVLEAVFLMLLKAEVGSTELLAALLAYRAVFYLLPLCVAAFVYLWLEIRFRQSQRSQPGGTAGAAPHGS